MISKLNHFKTSRFYNRSIFSPNSQSSCNLSSIRDLLNSLENKRDETAAATQNQQNTASVPRIRGILRRDRITTTEPATVVRNPEPNKTNSTTPSSSYSFRNSFKRAADMTKKVVQREEERLIQQKPFTDLKEAGDAYKAMDLESKRFTQQQQNLAIKRQQFQATLPPEPKRPVTTEEPGTMDVAAYLRMTMAQQQKHIEPYPSHNPPKSKSSTDKENQTSARGTVVKQVEIPSKGLPLRELASKLSLKTALVREKLEELGELESQVVSARSKLVRHNKRIGAGLEDEDGIVIDADVAELLVLELGLSARRVSDLNEVEEGGAAGPTLKQVRESQEKRHREELAAAMEEASQVPARPPVVCVLGHVDHGKTTLLDALRKVDVKVAGSEAGGITQKLSAFSVKLSDDKKEVVFLDTPGHAAFSAMRSHGAMATDVALLVVALDDGVRPQTVEAMKLAKEAGCGVVVVLNKVDKVPDHERANARNRVLGQLMEHELITEDHGGDVQVVEVAGKTGEGINALVDSILLQADVMELRAAKEAPAEAVVLDANTERGRGVVADVIVRWGTLSVGDPVVVGSCFGRVKALRDASGKNVKQAGPSHAVRLMGLRQMPMVGQELIVVESEGTAHQVASRRERLAELRLQRDLDHHSEVERRELEKEKEKLALSGEVVEEESNVEMKKKETPVLSVLLKADGVCTLEALQNVFSQVEQRCLRTLAPNAEEAAVKLQLVGSSVGEVTRSDLDLVSAATHHPAVLCFNVGVADSATRLLAKQLDIGIYRDSVIYRLEEVLTKELESLLPKEKRLDVEGFGIVKKIFHLNNKKKTVVAGLIVEEGKLHGHVEQKQKNSKHEHMQRHGHKDQVFVYRVTRGDQIVVSEFQLEQTDLKRFKDSVNTVETGNECGLSLNGFNDFKEGDLVECIRVSWKTRSIAD